MTPHESARDHVSGSAIYTDDLAERIGGVLHAWPVMSPHAHAHVVSLDASGAMEEEGVVAIRNTGENLQIANWRIA